MPLIVMSGYPSSGKSSWTKKLEDYLRTECGKEVFVVREDEHFRGEKNDILDDSLKEKELRAKIRAEAQRHLTKENVVIIDALNYIKGYRYELFCMSKAIPTRQVTVHCDISREQAWEWNSTRTENEKYKKEVFDNLIQRFELPDSQNRWDSPFFSVLPGEDLDMPAIYNSLYFNRAPKQNQSTQCKPLSASNYLSSLEKVTSDIIQVIIDAQKKGIKIEEIEVPHSKAKISLEETASLVKLTKLKRQFINSTKTSSIKGDLGDMFVHYLNSQFKECNL